ncbi:MAG: insulinase family protein [Oscillospiraceae bacterium]|nr:insulinase family protein [Oscillospiraceae bacterium]
MAVKYTREKLSDGIHYNSLINKRQKTNTLIIHLITELSPETASVNAIIPYVLSGSSESYPTLTALNKKLSSLYGAVIKGSVSKIGDSQTLSLMAGCINNRYTFDGEKITEEMTEMLAGCLVAPNTENGGFFEKDFLLKKQELLDDIDAEINEKRSYAFKRANLNIFKDEPAAISVKGDKSHAEKLTAKAAYEQYKKLLATAQIEVFFVGAEESESCKKIITDALASVDRNYAGDNTSAKSLLKSELCRVTESHDVAQSKMVMAFKTDYDNLVAMKLMNAVFGATPISKLFMNVREKLSLCYYCSSGYNDKKGVLYVDSGVEHTNTGKAEAEILNQLKAMCDGDFTDEEMENARKAIINSWKGVSDGARSIAEWYFNQCYSGTAYSPEEQIEKLMNTTREDIIEAARSLKLDTVYVLTGKDGAEA